MESILLLKRVYEKIQKEGYEIVNIDSNIIAQEPKMMPYIPKMREILSDVLKTSQNQVSIKAKTNEKMDAVGQKLAIEAHAVVLLKRIGG